MLIRSGWIVLAATLLVPVNLLNPSLPELRPAPPEPPPAPATWIKELPPGTNLPTDAEAAAMVRRHAWEPRPENATANQTKPSGAVNWNWTNINYYPAAATIFRRVSGDFTGTTDESIQWAAAKWGFDEDHVRAIAVNESQWRMSAVGDYCSTDQRHRSFGILQIRHSYCSASFDTPLNNGGYPYAARHTALNLDWGLASIRAAFEGAWHSPNNWLYITANPAKGDWWGAVGYYFSGQWHDPAAEGYIVKIKQVLAEKPWIAWGWPPKS